MELKRLIKTGKTLNDGNSKKNKRCVICAAGPFTDAGKLRKYLHEDDWVIAADGGLKIAAALGLNPDLVVADFDSATQKQAGRTNAPMIVLPVHKDDTDTVAAAKIGLERGFRDFLLLGATGGRLDHFMANIAVLDYLIVRGAQAALADEQNYVRMVLPGSYTVDPVPNAHFSLLPYGGRVSGLTEKNVEYELENAVLTPDFPLGVSNEFRDRPVEINFSEGTLMIFISND